MSLKPMQAALMINKLLETWPIEDVAKFMCKSAEWCEKYSRLVLLRSRIQQMVDRGDVSVEYAAALTKMHFWDEQDKWLKENVNVSETK